MLANKEVSTKICGNCEFFDTKYSSDRTPFGKLKVNGQEVDIGVCRAEKGLVIGPVFNDSICKQPSGVFESKVEVRETVNA